MQDPDDPASRGNGSNQWLFPDLTEEVDEKNEINHSERKRYTPGAKWLREEDEMLFNYAGEKSARELGILLGRTEHSVQCRLSIRKVPGRLKDGFTPRMLAKDLHVGHPKIRQWLLDGKLECENLHVTRNSIKKLCERGVDEIVWEGKVLAVLGRAPQRVIETLGRSETPSKQKTTASRRRRNVIRNYTFARVGRILQINQEAVRQLVGAGLLKFSNLRIQEDALFKFLEEHPSEINWGLLGTDWLDWAGVSRPDGRPVGEKLRGALRHLLQVRICPGCHRPCRGNGYSTHIKSCSQTRDLEPEVLEWAALGKMA